MMILLLTSMIIINKWLKSQITVNKRTVNWAKDFDRLIWKSSYLIGRFFKLSSQYNNKFSLSIPSEEQNYLWHFLKHESIYTNLFVFVFITNFAIHQTELPCPHNCRSTLISPRRWKRASWSVPYFYTEHPRNIDKELQEQQEEPPSGLPNVMRYG